MGLGCRKFHMRYEIIPQSQATTIEFEFLKLVSAKARDLASDHTTASQVVSGRFDTVYFLGASFLTSVSLDELRPAWLNTMAELCQSSADFNRHVSSQHSVICSEIESALYYLALAMVEASKPLPPFQVQGV